MLKFSYEYDAKHRLQQKEIMYVMIA